MKVTEIAFTCYPSKDIARSCAFYEGVLGLTKTMDHETESDQHWVEFDIGSGTLGLGKMDGWEASSGGATIGLEVEDFDQAVAAVQTAGVPVTMGPMETPVCHMLMITDPDGSPVIIHKRKPGHG